MTLMATLALIFFPLLIITAALTARFIIIDCREVHTFENWGHTSKKWTQ